MDIRFGRTGQLAPASQRWAMDDTHEITVTDQLTAALAVMELRDGGRAAKEKAR